ncbi:ribosomal l24e protein [Rutstroemia sp. NJR-2017a WRK4]|nr:ribosomal l24e protein [Rutstroemia sp. NJR-2017a WRK4]
MQHHPHHSQQGPPPPHHLQQPRPSSIVHQHHQQAPPQPQHSNGYPSAHGLSQYPQTAAGPGGQHHQELPYYTTHPSPYSTPSASGTYSSAGPETPDIMAATQQMSRPPYPPIYQTPQSNSPASVASPAHEHRMYAPPSQMQQNTQIPRTKMEPHAPQIARPAAPLGPPQHSANGTPQMQQNSVPGGGASGVNPNAAPGPIPATTPLVVRQDNNGVQWIAFEYSRDRVKMEYTIRCDVESVNVETLSPEFKTENCVYPRACCSKDQYRGNRLVYETECNTVGWALAELNPCLRGKRGLIQRAVDSWRNSNQDPRLRSRRVRRMAKISNRKAVQAATHQPHMTGPSPTGMPASSNMGPGATGSMGKPNLSGMGGPQLHHHHAHPDGNTQGGDEVGNDEYVDEQHHHHHQAPNGQSTSSGDDIRQNHVFQGYSSNYPSNPSVGGASMAPGSHDGRAPIPHGSRPIAARSKSEEDDRADLFGDVPEAKKRKFILVEDPVKGSRIRVRVTLDTVDINEIPDSFRKSNSVYPRSWFPLQMQSPPPSAHGSRFFEDDDVDSDVEAGRTRRGRTMVTVPLADGGEGEIAMPRMRKSQRSKEVKLNDLGYRMTWHQSRTFADKTVFLQKALDAWRNKVKENIEKAGKDVATTVPHFDTRVGKRRWTERSKREKMDTDP